MPTTQPEQSACLSRRARFIRGAKLGLPILLGYMPVGVAFGVVARQVGFTPPQAIICSATALAGAGQFIALSLLKSSATAFTILLATGIVNLRYVLFGATLSPHLRRTPRLGQALLAYTVTDETFAININDFREGKADGYSVAGVGAIAWVGWVAGTALGTLAAGLIGDPNEWGVQFAMPAMFTALLVAQAESKRHIAIGACAGVLAIIGMLALPGRWYVIAAPMIAAAIGAVTEK